ncbi:D-Ala-D-Ala carboxypeptidase family metallohydrolase [Nitrosomonas sp. Nm132]|uniref:D-Ala-D-Ala carboxypeptidase family metallohydrolase n=1 Tax=Nitrosomonas sp. Nm132 TaxID=1881053 RepID=UPI00088B4364|nr:D-Ala-D-Ala carboxypeptidase family metallohydrolase [Nitrosomonas sp. Nm132]SDH27861.1 Peptidase M15 [Nitrosomonas sp. Nm132]
MGAGSNEHLSRKLSPHFTLDELIHSDKAIELGIDNTPPVEVLSGLILLCEKILEPVRAHYGKPFRPNSGYRSPALNKAIPGSSKTSQHMLGQAVDFEVPGVSNYDLACWVKDNLIFDQLILENYTSGIPSSGWVHVSLKPDQNRMQCLTIKGKNKQQGLIK